MSDNKSTTSQVRKPRKPRKGRSGEDYKAAFGQESTQMIPLDPNKAVQTAAETKMFTVRQPRAPGPSDLDWIQAHGPVGDTKADGTKASRPEIVRANLNELNRRNTPDMDQARAAVEERRNAQQAGQQAPDSGDFKVAFGMDGRPVGFSAPQGDKRGAAMPLAFGSDPHKINQTGDFLEGERAAIKQQIEDVTNDYFSGLKAPQSQPSQVVAPQPKFTFPGMNAPVQPPVNLPTNLTPNDTPQAYANASRKAGLLKNADKGYPVPNVMNFGPPKNSIYTAEQIKSLPDGTRLTQLPDGTFTTAPVGPQQSPFSKLWESMGKAFTRSMYGGNQ